MSDSAPPPPPPENPYGQNPPPGPGYGQNPYGQAPPPGPGYGQSPAPGAGPYGPPGAGAPGGVGARIGARILDFIIIGIVANIVSAVLTGGSMYGTDRSYADVAISGVVTAVIYLAYFALMESSTGQTVGKMAAKLRVLGPTGEKPTLAEAAKRNLWVALNILAILGVVGTFIGGLATLVIIIVLIVQAANEAAGRVTFMDKFAGGTRVVKSA